MIQSPPTRSTPYSNAALRPLVRPRAVCVIGASETPGSFGGNTLNNIKAHFEGAVYPVNPKREMVFGERCYASVADLPEVPDLAIVIVPAAAVEATLIACADLGVPSAIVYSSGFAELGTDAAIAAQARIAALAIERNIRVVGPNCIGIATLDLGLGATFMPSFRDLPLSPGPVGIVTQSGALGYMLLQALHRGVGFSHWLTTGNACDVDVADYVNYLVDDDGTKAIACSFEGLAQPDRFLAAARRALVAGKPLVVLKVGKTEAGRQAALSHTGSLVGSAAAYRAALESVGAVLVEDFDALVETAGLLAKAEPPTSEGVAVITMSGGAGIMALDMASEYGVTMPLPADATRAAIRAVIPPFGAATNPADLTGDSIRFPAMYADTLAAFAADPAYGAIVVVMASGGYGQLADDRAIMIETAARASGKAVAVIWMNEWLEGPGSALYDASQDIASFRSLRRCMAALSSWQIYHRRRAVLIERQADSRSERGAILPAKTRALTERASKELLAGRAIPVTRETLVATVGEAMRLADEIGYPVVLKAQSEDIPHKSDAGVVKLGLFDAQAVRAAWSEIEAAIERIPGSPDVEGILVQEMIPAGVEIIVGARLDDQFGPLVSCGLGGIAVELLRDVAVALAPVGTDEAREMIESLKGYALLTGFRGSPPADVDALAAIVSDLSHFAWDHRDTVVEIDINPVIVKMRGAVAVDALLIVADACASELELLAPKEEALS